MQLLTQHLQAISDTIDFPYIDTWFEDWVDIPVGVVMVYMVMVLWVPNNYMKKREPYHLKMLNTLWNLFISAFSFVGAYYCVPRLLEIVTAPAISGLEPSALHFVKNMTASMRRNIIIPENFVEGGDTPVAIRGSFDTSVCVWKDDMYRRGITGLISLAFTLSKIPEMLDTAFLVFQKKNFNFLHWYHHTTVMLFCWHSWMSVTSSGLWYSTMNFCVHSVMYLYYFIFSIGYGKYIRRFAPIITFLQISQMVFGSFICFYVYVRYAFLGGCDCSPSNARLALMMYGSYLYLFCEYFVKRYVKKSSAKGKEDEKLQMLSGATAEMPNGNRGDKKKN